MTTPSQLDPYFHRQPPVDLREWLAIATRGLELSVKARIRAEIETHYTQAEQHYREAGLAEVGARHSALTDLGDAHAAARRFRREYPVTRFAAFPRFFAFLRYHFPPKPQNLAEWLVLVTRSFIPSAQVRIRKAVEAQYAQALQQHLSQGRSETGAATAALADLGSVTAATRRFRREHLTRQEVNNIIRFGDIRFNLYFLIVCTFNFLCMGVTGMYHLPAAHHLSAAALWVVIWLLVGVEITLFAANHFLLGRRISLANVRLNTTLRLLTVFLLGLLFLVYLWGTQVLSGWAALWGLILLPLYGFGLHQLFRLRKKLATATEADFAPATPAIVLNANPELS